ALHRVRPQVKRALDRQPIDSREASDIMRRETRQCQSRSRQTDRMPVARRRAGTPVLVLLAALALCGCEATTLKHGTQFHDGDLQQIQPGMSQEQVRMNLGTPATTAVVNNGQAFYYISSTQTQSAFFLP